MNQGFVSFFILSFIDPDMSQHDGTVMLASLSLTHVQFDARDKIAYAFAYITLLPLAILVFYASVVVSRREIAGILMLLGQLTNEALNAVLKEYLQIARPYCMFSIILYHASTNMICIMHG